MVEPWVLWIPVVAAAVGGLTGAAASIGSAVVANRLQGMRERDARRNLELDSAELALKDIGQQMIRHVMKPGWWPNIEWLRTPRDFAYDVVRLVPDEKATNEWASTAQEILAANTSLLAAVAVAPIQVRRHGSPTHGGPYHRGGVWNGCGCGEDAAWPQDAKVRDGGGIA